MARTYKLYGCTHDDAGSLDVVITVGGNEVFNSTITADTEEHDSSEPLLWEHVLSFEVPEETTGNQAMTVSVTGSHDSGELYVYSLECNKVRPNMQIALEYFTDKINAMEDAAIDQFAPDVQAYIANTLGETALGTEIYNKLLAGNGVPAQDAAVVMPANELEGLDESVYYPVNSRPTNVNIDGEAYDMSNEGSAIPVLHGHTATFTWDLTPETFEYDPPLTA